MKTFTTTTQAQSNYDCAAEEILTVLEDLGFTTESPVDNKELCNRISGIILKNVSGNTTYNYEP